MPRIFWSSRREDKHTCRPTGFTLIELLVVIAIISLLAAILFPVFARARENARRASCLSNTKQIGLGILQYAQDYDEYLPVGATNGGQGWIGRTLPYLKSSQIFVCPSDASTPDYGVKISYAYNQNLNAPSGVLTPTKLSALNAPALTVNLFEVAQGETHRVGTTSEISATETGSPAGSGYYGSYPNGAVYATGNFGRAFSNPAFTTEPRHLDGANFLACDGHAKWLKGTAVSGGSIAVSETALPTVAGKSTGTGNMTDGAGGTFQLTFSPV